MIYDNIQNRERYYGLGPYFQVALDYFADYNGGDRGKEDIALSEGLIVKVRPIYTKPEMECKLEAHKRFADIHFVAEGTEIIECSDGSAAKADLYDQDKDTAFYSGTGMPLLLNQGRFLIFFPGELHMPCVSAGESGFLRKLIAKIPMAANRR